MNWGEMITFYTVCAILVLIGILVAVSKSGFGAPLDDSNWNYDLEDIKAKLKKFVGKTEEIIGILGINNVVKLMKRADDKNGFCILTDKAFYFIGNVHSVKNGVARKGNVQQRINREYHRAIGAEYKKEELFTLLLFASVCELCMAVAGVCELADGNDYMTACTIYFFTGIVALAQVIYCWVCLKKRRNLVVEIEFVNEKYMFQVNQLGAKEIKTFYRQLNSVCKQESE